MPLFLVPDLPGVEEPGVDVEGPVEAEDADGGCRQDDDGRNHGIAKLQ